MGRLRRVAAVHDISGVGKCSLTAALPVISAAGVECAALPTAVLSTHTGEIEGFTYRDLTEDLLPICRHWQSLGLEFDALYSGFLGSARQVDMVCEMIDSMRRDGFLAIVDPAMADGGKLYKTFPSGFAATMRALCRKADVLLPNLTEAAFLLDVPYHPGPYDRGEIEALLRGLAALGPRVSVLTGVALDPARTGCAVLDAADGRIEFYESEKYPGVYYGTGDLFASALTGALLRGADAFQSAQLALDFTCAAVGRTYHAGTDPRFGVAFEPGLGDYIQALEAVL
ncbi:MAG: pyridoxamine kinase [Clostridia bacterium]|nr:pyridoxamine kinase [Clostridia bacterium]